MANKGPVFKHLIPTWSVTWSVLW